MKFSLIICTYQRPEALLTLLNSVREQSLYPDQVIVVDGSEDNRSKDELDKNKFSNLEYFKVSSEERGLTKQRNIGVDKLHENIDIACFLDDDIVLTPHYFQNLITGFNRFPDAVGFGGYILDETNWEKKNGTINYDEFEIDGFVRKLGSRNLLRKRLGLLSNKPPGIMPDFSNGLAVSFLPPTGEIYEVEYFMGGAAAYNTSIFRKIKFSSYFEGYGLYEDMDFCLRAGSYGKLYVNTAATLYHYHEASGRPDYFKYGQMVINNGWYVWHLKYPRPTLKALLKWVGTALLLILIRLGNIINTEHRSQALGDALGRITALITIPLNKNLKR